MAVNTITLLTRPTGAPAPAVRASGATTNRTMALVSGRAGDHPLGVRLPSFSRCAARAARLSAVIHTAAA